MSGEPSVASIAMVSALGGLTFGYNTLIISTARAPMMQSLEITSNTDLFSGLITSAVLLGAMIGSILGSFLAERLGRRMGTLISCGVCIFGVLTQSFAPEIVTLLIFRVVLGIGIGLIGVLCPLYVGEKAPQDKKGIFGVLFQLVLTFGILVANFVGWGLLKYNNTDLNWRIMTGIGIIFPIALFILAFTSMKEPRQGMRLAEEEVTALHTRDTTDIQVPKKTGFAGLFSRESFKYLFLGIMLSATLQLTGINAVMFFAPDILQSSVSDQYLASAGVGAWNFLTTFIAAIFVERLGRRKLMIGGTLVLTLALIFIGITFFFFKSGSTQGWMVIAGIAVYLLGFEGGPGCLFWVLINELFPVEIRAAANSFCNIVQWGFNLIISTSFPILLDKIGKDNAYYIFWAYGGIGLVCATTLCFLQKETKKQGYSEDDYE